MKASRIGRDVVYIPNGVDVDRFKRVPQPARRGQVQALFVGRLALHKNWTF